ncbi:MAG: hypothetical protein AB1599_02715 [Planctomycetota bacterium]
MTYNDANQLLTDQTGITGSTYQYDANGNLTAKTDATGSTINLSGDTNQRPS